MIDFIILEIWVFLGGLAIITGWQLLTGKINLSGLLYEDLLTNKFSPGRVQLLVATMATALFYLLKVVNDPTELPLLPQEMLMLAGGGNLLYLSGKSFALVKKLNILSGRSQ